MWNSFIIAVLLCFSASVHAQSCPNTLKVGTFNTLQIAFAPYKTNRLEATADYFEGYQQDLQVLCLQELWNPSDRNYIINELKEEYPYSYYAPQFVQQECTGGCRSNEVGSIRSCLDISNCFSISDGQSFSDCVSNNCRDNLEGLSATCATCLLQDQRIGDAFRNLDNCLSNDENANNNQTCFAFDGWSDNLILSKIPFVTQEFLRFSQSPITYTTALYVQIDAPDVGRTDFFCTHLLPADLPVLDFEQATNLEQSQELLNWANSKSANMSAITVLAGDFNHGPGEWDSNYDFIINSGYSSSYITSGNRNCTYCNSNPLATGSLTAIIDHIYVRGAPVSSTARFATYYEYKSDSRGSRDDITISDHYGVRADICPYDGTTQTGVTASSVSVRDDDTFNNSAFSLIPAISFLIIAILM